MKFLCKSDKFSKNLSLCQTSWIFPKIFSKNDSSFSKTKILRTSNISDIEIGCFYMILLSLFKLQIQLIPRHGRQGVFHTKSSTGQISQSSSSIEWRSMKISNIASSCIENNILEQYTVPIALISINFCQLIALNL